MENIIPILIMIALFVIRTVNNYKKEQEKAMKRQMGKPIVPPSRPQTSMPSPQAGIPSHPSPVLQEATVSDSPSSPYAQYQGIIDTNTGEAGALEKRRNQTGIQKQASAVQTPEPNNTLEHIQENFDLEQAVIFSAILNRPHT